MLRRLTALSVVIGLSGCGLMPEQSLHYRQAKDLPPLVLPEGQGTTRPIQSLYGVPAAREPRSAVVLTERDGRRERFVIPAPAPMQIQVAGADAPVPAATGNPAGRPRLVTDGNGYPLLQVDGDPDMVWDSLNRALVSGRIQVDDRNQSLGIYYITLPAAGKQPDLQLKVTRTAGTSVLFLQLNEDTVADTALARHVFAKLLESWPG